MYEPLKRLTSDDIRRAMSIAMDNDSNYKGNDSGYSPELKSLEVLFCELESSRAAQVNANDSQPWQNEALNDWAICGMNHYHVEGERFLFVSMVKDGQCIREEGVDDLSLWERLSTKAKAVK